MKIKLFTAILTAVAMFSSLALNASQTRKTTDEGDNLWTNSANWSTGLIPGDGDAGDVTFTSGSKSQSTLLSAAVGTTYSIGKLTMGGGDLEISGATLYLNNWFATGIDGTGDNYNSTSIIVSNGGTLSTGAFSMGDKLYTNSSITVGGGSYFNMRTDSTIGSRANTKSDIVIEKGGTWATQKLVLGSANADITTVVNVSLYGSHTITKNMSVGEGGATAGYNIYGSGTLSFADSTDKRFWLKANGTVGFIMQDVSNDKVVSVSGGVIAGGAVSMFDFGDGTFSEKSGKFILDFTDFSVDGVYAVGEQCAISILQSRDAGLINMFQTKGEESLGTDKEWSLAGADKSDYLKYENGTYYLLVEYNGAIPEPATYAAIFGALALAFAAYRRRK